MITMLMFYIIAILIIVSRGLYKSIPFITPFSIEKNIESISISIQLESLPFFFNMNSINLFIFFFNFFILSLIGFIIIPFDNIIYCMNEDQNMEEESDINSSDFDSESDSEIPNASFTGLYNDSNNIPAMQPMRDFLEERFRNFANTTINPLELLRSMNLAMSQRIWLGTSDLYLINENTYISLYTLSLLNMNLIEQNNQFFLSDFLNNLNIEYDYIYKNNQIFFNHILKNYLYTDQRVITVLGLIEILENINFNINYILYQGIDNYIKIITAYNLNFHNKYNNIFFEKILNNFSKNQDLIYNIKKFLYNKNIYLFNENSKICLSKLLTIKEVNTNNIRILKNLPDLDVYINNINRNDLNLSFNFESSIFNNLNTDKEVINFFEEKKELINSDLIGNPCFSKLQNENLLKIEKWKLNNENPLFLTRNGFYIKR